MPDKECVKGNWKVAEGAALVQEMHRQLVV
jgi:hypothetical protein